MKPKGPTQTSLLSFFGQAAKKPSPGRVSESIIKKRAHVANADYALKKPNNSPKAVVRPDVATLGFDKESFSKNDGRTAPEKIQAVEISAKPIHSSDEDEEQPVIRRRLSKKRQHTIIDEDDSDYVDESQGLGSGIEVIREEEKSTLKDFSFGKLGVALPEVSPKRKRRFRNVLVDSKISNVEAAKEMSKVDRGAHPWTLEAPPRRQPRAKANYTPLETQFVSIKNEHPDCVLMIECGYKFVFKGHDAMIASSVLSIVAYKDHNFMNASVPTHRIFVHCKRLVEAGYKVGLVRQMETAALKAAGANKSKTFKRELTALYTKGTFVLDEADYPVVDASLGDFGKPGGSFLVCLKESDFGMRSGTAQLSFVAVDTATGDIFYDDFQDDMIRSQLETRLMHLNPVEIVLPETVTVQTERMLESLTASSDSEPFRQERISGSQFAIQSNTRVVEEFVAAQGFGGEYSLSQVLRLSEGVVCCFGVLVTYLRKFKLQGVLSLIGNLSNFSSKSSMQLPATTLRNLAVLETENSVGHGGGHSGLPGTSGSLFSFICHTKTKFGRRLLRRWLSRPLTNRSDIQSRLDAVEELSSANVPRVVDELRQTLAQTPDLERGLARIFYSICSPREFLTLVQIFIRLVDCFLEHTVSEATFSSYELKRLMSVGSNVRGLKDTLTEFLGELDLEAANKNERSSIFRQPCHRYPEVAALYQSIGSLQDDLEDHLVDIRREIGISSLSYVTKNQVEYCIEVPNKKCSKLPKTWIKVCQTKALARFHTPFIADKVNELEQLREQLVAETNSSWRLFQGQLSEHYGLLREVVSQCGQLDCLMAIAHGSSLHNWHKPTLCEENRVSIVNGRHPVVDGGGTCVPNSLELDGSGTQHSCRAAVITGPNMGGKSSFIKMIATCVLLCQVGSFVPADEATLGVFDGIYIRAGASDDLVRGRSTFYTEVAEASDILGAATERSLVIMDELGRGTATLDGTAIAYATLEHVVTQIRCPCLFVTHYPVVCDLAEQFPGLVQNYHMTYFEKSASQSEEQNITFLYKLGQGPAQKSYGLNVARLANIPRSIIDVAKEMSAELEAAVSARSQSRLRS